MFLLEGGVPTLRVDRTEEAIQEQVLTFKVAVEVAARILEELLINLETV